MKIKTLLLSGAILGAAVTGQAQQWTIDTLHTGTGYLNNVYYSLENGSAKESAADNWHLAFSTARMSASILTNSADKGCKLYALDGDTTDFGTDLTAALATAITNEPMPLYNSNITWDVGAFNQNIGSGSMDYGWGEYNMNTHLITGTSIYALITSTDTFQIYISVKDGLSATTNAPVYVFKYAQLDGTAQVTKKLEAGVAAYTGQNFVYYNIETDQFLSREPKGTDWDFVFTNYNDEAVVMGNSLYKVFGILLNANTELSHYSVAEFASNDTLDHTKLSLEYSDTINAFGYNKWKNAGMSGAVAFDTVSWFVKVQNGDIWQVVYTDFVSGSASVTVNPGMVVLQKRKVYEAPVDTTESINDLNININALVVAPNPAVNGTTNLVIDAKTTVNNVSLQIVDINGRVVNAAAMQIRQGFNQYPVQVQHLNTGLYFIRLEGEGVYQTVKFIKE